MFAFKKFVHLNRILEAHYRISEIFWNKYFLETAMDFSEAQFNIYCIFIKISDINETLWSYMRTEI